MMLQQWKPWYNRLLVIFAAVLAVAVLYSVNHRPQRQNESDSPQQAQQTPRITLKDNEIELLARAVYAEAKGEPYEGKVAIAAVILNRVDHPEFPNTIAGVIYEPLAFQVVANGQINQKPDQSALQAAYDAINGVDPTNGALYFYNPAKTQNQWIRSRKVLKTIGKHVFAS